MPILLFAAVAVGAFTTLLIYDAHYAPMQEEPVREERSPVEEAQASETPKVNLTETFQRGLHGSVNEQIAALDILCAAPIEDVRNALIESDVINVEEMITALYPICENRDSPLYERGYGEA